MTGSTENVYGGIDTHQNTNHVGIINEVGKKLADKEFPATSADYEDLLSFVLSFGVIIAIGIEGTVSYGAGIIAYLRSQNIRVKEVIRFNRQTRRGGKSDPIDAYAAAKTIAAGSDHLPIPKLLGGPSTASGCCSMPVQPRSKPRTAATTQIIHFLTTAPTDAGRNTLSSRVSSSVPRSSRLAQPAMIISGLSCVASPSASSSSQTRSIRPTSSFRH